jgi:hypothetical protein
MASKRAILDIGTCNYHSWPWDMCLIGRPPLHNFHHIFLLFGHDNELLISIRHGFMAIVNSNDLIMWL